MYIVQGCCTCLVVGGQATTTARGPRDADRSVLLCVSLGESSTQHQQEPSLPLNPHCLHVCVLPTLHPTNGYRSLHSQNKNKNKTNGVIHHRPQAVIRSDCHSRSVSSWIRGFRQSFTVQQDREPDSSCESPTALSHSPSSLNPKTLSLKDLNPIPHLTH